LDKAIRNIYKVMDGWYPTTKGPTLTVEISLDNLNRAMTRSLEKSLRTV